MLAAPVAPADLLVLDEPVQAGGRERPV